MTITRKMPSVAELKEWFDYDPETGEVRWRPRPLHTFSTEKSGRLWNARYAGAVAGCTYHKAGKYQHPRIFVTLNYEKYSMARVVWTMHHGKDPGAKLITFLNDDRTDLRIANLTSVHYVRDTIKTKADKEALRTAKFERLKQQQRGVKS